MPDLRLGIIIILISAFGYLSNFLNGRYLNYGPVRFLYYLGALVHETSHAILCLLTGAKIESFAVFSDQPHVAHEKSKLPLLGELLISIAPIAGGLFFLFLVDRYLLGGAFVLPHISMTDGRYGFLLGPLRMLFQINLLQWQSWAMIFLSLNAGAMLGPSFQDLKNAWPGLVVLFFVSVPGVEALGLFALDIIGVGIFIQAIAIFVLRIVLGIRR